MFVLTAGGSVIGGEGNCRGGEMSEVICAREDVQGNVLHWPVKVAYWKRRHYGTMAWVRVQIPGLAGQFVIGLRIVGACLLSDKFLAEATGFDAVLLSFPALVRFKNSGAHMPSSVGLY